MLRADERPVLTSPRPDRATGTATPRRPDRAIETETPRPPDDASGTPTHLRPDRATQAAFVATILIGGVNAIAVRFTLRELPPFWGASLRFILAAALLGTVALLVRRRAPQRRHIRGIVLFGLFNYGLTDVFLYFGLRDAPAGTTAVITALVPLLTLLLAVAQRIERFRPAGLAGSLIAASGIAVIFSNQVSLSVPAIALFSLVIASLSIAQTSVLVKRFPPGDPIIANALAMPIGAAVLVIVSLVGGEHWLLPVRTESWLALGYLIVFATIINFSLTLFVLSRWSASVASYGFLLSPLVTIVLGALLLNETVQPAFILGGALVLAGVYVGAFLRPGSQQLASPDEPAEGLSVSQR
jgi:drug/metabolite transporter (DMT)-like permease